MSFSSDVRLELARLKTGRQCCVLSETAAVILASGGLSFRGAGRYGLSIQAEDPAIIRRYFGLFKRYFNAGGEIRASHTARLGGQTHYTLKAEPADVPGLLSALELLDEDAPFGMRSTPDEAMLRRECCRRAFLRGAFLAGGSLNNPEKAYHLEIAVGDEQLAGCIVKIMDGFGLNARLTQRKSQYLAYLKGSEPIADLLRLMGASGALLQLENVRIVKGVRNEVNRQVNCDQSNLDKTISAAQRQISMIRAIERKAGLDAIPPHLREIAELRLRYPDASLTELGGMATPSIGKSGVNARMRKLEALAEELVNQ